MSRGYYRVYGIINDDNIRKIELLMGDETYTQTEFYDDMFLFTGRTPVNGRLSDVRIKGYDSDDRLVYEKE